VIARQLAMFTADRHDLLLRVEQARVSYTHAGSEQAEERFGDYMDLVEEAEEELLELRDRYAGTMAERGGCLRWRCGGRTTARWTQTLTSEA
jgi:hypothetical protein